MSLVSVILCYNKFISNKLWTIWLWPVMTFYKIQIQQYHHGQTWQQNIKGNTSFKLKALFNTAFWPINLLALICNIFPQSFHLSPLYYLFFSTILVCAFWNSFQRILLCSSLAVYIKSIVSHDYFFYYYKAKNLHPLLLTDWYTTPGERYITIFLLSVVFYHNQINSCVYR